MLKRVEAEPARSMRLNARGRQSEESEDVQTQVDSDKAEKGSQHLSGEQKQGLRTY